MKRLPVLSATLVLVAAFAGLTGLHCDSKNPDVLLALTITSQPVGGSGITTVSCTYRATSWNDDGEPGDLAQPIVVETYWQSPHDKYNQEEHTWTQHDQTQTFTTSKTASGGHLDKPFWLVIKYTDKDGSRTVTSDTAYCD